MKHAARLTALSLVLLFGCQSESSEDAASSDTDAADPRSNASDVDAPVEPAIEADHGTHAGFTDVSDLLIGTVGGAAPSSSDDYFMPDLMGGGVAAFDANGDSRVDLVFLVDDPASRMRLFLQRADGRFEDASSTSGLLMDSHAMGCAIADVDNDGDVDLYVTSYNDDQLFINAGDGTFTNATAASGLANPGWGTSAAFLDFDRDGWLDLYVANYMDLDETKVCRDEAGRPDFCGPDFPAQRDRLFRNRGDGTFEDVSAASGIDAIAGHGLGVVCADVNDDGWMDIYVANDRDPNSLWINRGDGTFTDDAGMLGVAYNGHGKAEAGMGVTAGDVDDDGDLDFFITHLASETNTLYRNDRGMGYDDDSGRSGLGSPSLPYTGWGTSFFDADLDGDLDLAVVNGAVQRRATALRNDGSFWCDYAEPNALFLNDGTGSFERSAPGAGAFAAAVAVSRGVIPIDLDGDGDQDLVVTDLDGSPRLYRNDCAESESLTIRVVDPALRRDAIGARVIVHAGTQSFVRHAIPPGGYLSGAPSTIHFGGSFVSTIDAIEVRWPDGTTEFFTRPPASVVVLERGTGTTSR